MLEQKLEALTAQLSRLATAVEALQPTTTESKPKPKPKAKAEKKVAPKEEAKEVVKAPTLEDATAITMKLSEKSKTKAREVVQQFARKVSAIPEDQLAAYIDAAESALAELG